MPAKPPPWRKPAPRKTKPTRLTAAWAKKAATRARKAGRRYPNLVDNMWAAQQQNKTRKSG
jgi:hypothetical protein